MNEQKQLIEYMIQDVVDMLATDQNIEYDEAMNKFYNSEVFEKLQDEETAASPELSAPEEPPESVTGGSTGVVISVPVVPCCPYSSVPPP